MDIKKFLGILVFCLFLFNGVFAVTVTDVPQVTDSSNQSFAQINARLVEMSTQLSALKTQISLDSNNVFTKSDLQFLFDNMVNIEHQSELSILTNMIILVILAFAVFFILIAKNMLPQYVSEIENSKLLKENTDLKKKIEELKFASAKPSGSGLLGKFFNSKATPSAPTKKEETKTELKEGDTNGNN